MTEPQPLPQREPDSISEDDMPTVPIPARKVVTTFDAASKHERHRSQASADTTVPPHHYQSVQQVGDVLNKHGAQSQLVSARGTICRLRHRTLLSTDLPNRVRSIQTSGGSSDPWHPCHAHHPLAAYEGAHRHRRRAPRNRAGGRVRSARRSGRAAQCLQ